MNRTRIRMIVADGHTLFRQGLVRMLQDELDLAVVGAAANGREAVRLARELLPDVAVLGPSIGGGLATCCRMKAEAPCVAVVVLALDEDGQYREQAMRAGADEYLVRDVDAEQLAEAIRTVAGRAAPIEPPPFSPDAPEEEKAPGLTERELEVLQLLAVGVSNRDLAAALGISEKTAKNHLTRIFEKLGVSDRTQAALFAVRAGLLEEESRQRVVSSRARAYTVS